MRVEAEAVKKTKAVSHFVMPKNLDNPAGGWQDKYTEIAARTTPFMPSMPSTDRFVRCGLPPALSYQSTRLWWAHPGTLDAVADPASRLLLLRVLGHRRGAAGRPELASLAPLRGAEKPSCDKL